MELNPFYQSDDDYEDERLDISNGNGNVENHDYEDEQLDISNGNVENDENGNKSKSRPQRYNTVKNEEKLKMLYIGGSRSKNYELQLATRRAKNEV